VILTNVQVLAAGTKIEREAGSNKPMPVSVVTLLVDPDEAERLTLASSEGKIQLALRNPLDKGTTQTRGVRPAMLLGLAVPVRQTARAHGTAVAAPALPPLPATVEIIRGDKRAHEVVRQEP
jgi:pilus assembly protein CpaB